MARALGPIAIILAIVLAYWLFLVITRRHQRARARIAREDALADWQAQRAREDLERHRQRMENSLDRMHDPD